MKKTISLVLCLALSGFVLSGCSESSEPYEEKSYTPDAQVSAIDVDVRDRALEVTPSEDGKIHVLYYENSKEYYDISVSEGVLTMSGESDKEWTDYIGGKPPAEARKIVLQVPDSMLDSLTLSTTNENITLPALSATGSINLSANGGDIIFGDLDVGRTLTLNVKNGDITGTVVGSYDAFEIQTDIKKGESTLPDSKTGGEKTLNVACNNGDVNVEFTNG